MTVTQRGGACRLWRIASLCSAGGLALLALLIVDRTHAAATDNGPILFYTVEIGPPRPPDRPPYEPREGPCEWRIVKPGPGTGPHPESLRTYRYLTTPSCPGNDLLFDARRRCTYFALENRKFFVHFWGTPAPRPLPERFVGDGIKEWYLAPDTGLLHVRRAFPNPAERHGYTEGLIVEDLTLAADLSSFSAARSTWPWTYTDERPQLPPLATRAESYPITDLLEETTCGRNTCDLKEYAGSPAVRRQLLRLVQAARAKMQVRKEDGPARVAFLPFGDAALFYGVYWGGDMRVGGQPVYWARRDGSQLSAVSLPPWVGQVTAATRGRFALLRLRDGGGRPMLFDDESARPRLNQPDGHDAVWLPFSELCNAGCVETNP